MKHAVRSAILGLAAVCALAISGCGDSSRTAAPQNAQAQGNLMQKIKEKGKIVVGTSSGYPPYVFVDAASGEKKVIGLDIELAQQIADKLGVKLEVQDMGFSALLSSVTANKVDIAVGGIFPTAEREKAMAFSKSYLPTEQKLLIRKDDAAKYKTAADLKGAVIGAEKSTTQEAAAQKGGVQKDDEASLADLPLEDGEIAAPEVFTRENRTMERFGEKLRAAVGQMQNGVSNRVLEKFINLLYGQTETILDYMN